MKNPVWLSNLSVASVAGRTARFVLIAVLGVFAVLPALAQGPNITYSLTNAIGGLSGSNSAAADSAGNVYIAGTSLFKEVPNPDRTYTQSTITIGSGQPVGVAVDSAGAVYVANEGHNVYKETPSGGGYTESTVASSFNIAFSLALDAAGDVYVADAGTGAIYLEKLSGGTYTKSTLVTGLNFSQLGQIAVDSAGNIYVAETANNRALKETLSNGTYTQSVILDSTTYNYSGTTITPYGIAVDSSGAVIIANQNYGVFKAVPNGATYKVQPIVFGNANTIVAGGAASIDSHGNLYIAGVDVYIAAQNELAESSSAENFGSLNVGTAAPAQTATFTFDVGGTLATAPYAVSTQGDLTLDFQPAATQAANVCVTGKTYNAGDTCTVAATFTPTRPGARYGAIAIFGPSGAPIATSYLQGVGVSAQVSFSPGALSLSLGSTFSGYVTTDSSSEVIFPSTGAFFAEKYNVFPYTANTLTTSFSTGYVGSNGNSSGQNAGFGLGLVVDGAGNLIFSDGYNATAANPPFFTGSNGATSFSAWDLNPNLPVQTGGAQPIANHYGKAFLASIPITTPAATPPYNNRAAVDGAGNLYFSDYSNNQIVELQYIHGGYNKELVVATGFNNPGDVVVDAAGAVYVADSGNKRIVKETPKGDGTYTQTIVDNTLAYPPDGLAIDRVGNLYVSFNQGVQNLPVVKETFANGVYTQSMLALLVNTGLDADPAGNVFAVQAAGSVSNVQELDVATPPSFFFAQTAVGSTSSDSPKTVTITNNGNAPLSFANIAISTGFTLSPTSTCSQSSGSSTLAPAASCTLLINFTPTQGGTINGTVTLTDNHLGASAATQVIKLNGTATGAAAASATLTPGTYNYGSVNIGSTGSQAFTLTNTGTSSINIASTALPGTLFTLSGTTCGTSLAAGASCTYTIVFKPTATGVQTATFSVIDDAGTQTAALTGTGAQAPVTSATLTPAAVSFGSITVGATATQTLTLTNTGTVSLAINSYSTLATPFALSGTTCTSALAAGATCTFTVAYNPTTAGAGTGSFAVIDAAGTQSSTLSGTATAVAVPAATLTPATLSFGSITTGTKTAAQTATLTNTGNATLTISAISLTGTNSAAFTSTNTCGASLAAGASCTISVIFAPTATGTDSAAITVTDNAAGSPQTSTLSGTATAVVASDFGLSATPATQSVAGGSSAAYQIAVTPLNGSFTQAVTLAASGLPTGATVTFAPASVTPGSSAATSTMTIQTVALHAALTRGPSIWPLPAGVVGAMMLLLPFPRKRKFLTSLGCLLLLCAGTALTGCGGGFAFPQTAQTFTVTVTGTGNSLQHSTSVQITVR